MKRQGKERTLQERKGSGLPGIIQKVKEMGEGQVSVTGQAFSMFWLRSELSKRF